MTDVGTATVAPPRGVARRPRAWPPLALVLGTAAAYAVSFVLPYYVNGLDRFPLAEVASGGHDPKELWPSGTPLAPLFGYWQLFTLLCGPALAVLAPIWAVALLWRDRARHVVRDRLVLLLAVVGGVGVLVWVTSPFGTALINWWLD